MRSKAIVGYIYNQTCPLKCNFCCHTKGVMGSSRFTVEQVLQSLIPFSKLPTVIRFAFSGGDPFIHLEEILSIIQSARQAGVTQPFHLVSSGYWAKDYQKTLRCLADFPKLGIDSLDISYDYEHGRFVPKENIYNIHKACVELGIKLEIFGVFWSQDENLEELLPDLRGVVPLYTSLVVPIGAARSHFQSGAPRYNLNPSEKSSCGRGNVYDIAIYPDGRVYPCCSGGFNREAKLEIGNVYEDSASSIIERAFTNFHVRIAKEIGFCKLYERIATSRPDLNTLITKIDSVDSVCEICRDLHKNSDLLKELEPIYIDLEIEYALAALERERTFIEANSTGKPPEKGEYHA